MAPNFSKNAILKGPIDYFCLVCETYLTSEAEGEEHMSKPDHKKKLEAVSFVDEFREDRIRKIKNKYYCDYCNQLLPLMARVRLHVTEPLHFENKSRWMIRRFGQFIIAFEDIVIDNTAWQGICEGSCAICNAEYEDEETHKNDNNHILNMIQMKVEFDKDKNVYRKIDDLTFQCLTCNIVKSFNDMASHFTSQKHKQLYQVCQNVFYEEFKREVEMFFSQYTVSFVKDDDNADLNKTKQNKTDTSKEMKAGNKPKDDAKPDKHDEIKVCPNKNNKNPKTPTAPPAVDLKGKNRAKLLDAVGRFQNNSIKINFETKLAFCNKCKIDIEFEYDVIESHIYEHNKNKKPIKIQRQTVPRQFVMESNPDRNDNLFISPVLLKGEDELIFGVDKIEVPKTDDKKNVAASSNANSPNVGDVAGNLNVDDNNIPRNRIPREVRPSKIMTKNFLETIIVINSMLFKDIVINNNVCINYYSFNFMSYILDRMSMKCFACDKIVLCSDFETHYKVPRHDTILKKSFVIQIEGEFVREIRPGCFHCGFCNTLETSWHDMELHLVTSLHQECKNSAESRLQRYKPEITKDIYEKAATEVVYLNMFTDRLM